MKTLGADIWEMTPLDVQLPRRDREAHKGNFGKVFILAGSRGYAGAPCLAARGAVRSGAGLVTVGVPEAIKAYRCFGQTGGSCRFDAP